MPTQEDRPTLSVRSENRAIRAAYNELTSHLDYLKVSDLEENHKLSEDEAKRAMALLYELAAKLKGGGHG